MDVTFPLPSARSTTHLNKKLRFTPASNSTYIPFVSNGDVDQQIFDDPVLQQLCGQSPTPADIEAELLQVGMRVRKSVADGYKIKAFTPRPFFNMNRLSAETQAALSTAPVNRQPISTATFCGINLAALAHISSTPQEPPQMWTYSTSHKRGYEDDSDSDDQEFMPFTPKLGNEHEMMAIPVDYFSIDFDGSEEVSPMTQIGDRASTHHNARRLAIPKSRKQQPAGPQQESPYNPFAQLQLPSQMNGTQWMGHRRMASCGMQAAMFDFGEATFLQRREDIDMDCS